MARTIIPTDFFAEVFHEVQTLPLKGFAIAAVFGLISATIDLLARNIYGHISASEFLFLSLIVIFYVISVYLIAMMLIKNPASWLGGLRFLATMLVSIGLPLGMLFGGLWLMRGDNGGFATAILLAAAFVGLFGVPLLSGWPATQAQSSRLVSPMKIFRATKGYRWGLFVASYASTAINKIIPATDTAKSDGQAIVLAIGNGAVSCASVVLLAAMAATAWKFAIRADPQLAGAAPPAEG